MTTTKKSRPARQTVTRKHAAASKKPARSFLTDDELRAHEETTFDHRYALRIERRWLQVAWLTFVEIDEALVAMSEVAAESDAMRIELRPRSLLSDQFTTAKRLLAIRRREDGRWEEA